MEGEREKEGRKEGTEGEKERKIVKTKQSGIMNYYKAYITHYHPFKK
jgi:hypothetical protein